ncbi:MAG: alpha/beta hydrolase, partial [Alphaproteobacteria bacterium]|nr:alpha/beta hydrolase [Alphaproteobacteria bacterium]
MAKDERVARVTERWAPRFVINGVPLADWQEASRRIQSWNDWIDVWAGLAARHERLGHDALAAGRNIGAGEHLQTAGVVYHFAKFVFVEDMARLRAVHARAVECRRLALPHIEPPGERVAIPYDGAYLYGILRKPSGTDRPPVVVLCTGMDSAKEEMATNEAPFLARGMATLTFDGPGQGEGE